MVLNGAINMYKWLKENYNKIFIKVTDILLLVLLLLQIIIIGAGCYTKNIDYILSALYGFLMIFMIYYFQDLIKKGDSNE